MRRLERKARERALRGEDDPPGALLLRGDAAEDGVHEPRGARRELLRRGDRLRDGGVGRDPVHQEELRRAEAERRADRDVQGPYRAVQMPGEDVVQPESAAQRLLHEGAEEVPVPRRQRGAPGVEERRRVGAVPLDADQDAEREGTDGPGGGRRLPHDGQTSPAETRSPRTKSAAAAAFRPSAWSVRTATAPSPQATVSAGETERTVPGAAPRGTARGESPASFRRAPRRNVWRPGHGVKARSWRESATAESVQSTRPSSREIFGQ